MNPRKLKKNIRAVGLALAMATPIMLSACSGGGVASSGNFGGEGSIPDQFQSDAPVQFITYEQRLSLLTGGSALGLSANSEAVNILDNNALALGAMNPANSRRNLSFSQSAQRTWNVISDRACDAALEDEATVDRLFPNGYDDCQEVFNALVGRPMTDLELGLWAELEVDVTGVATSDERLYLCCYTVMASLINQIY